MSRSLSTEVKVGAFVLVGAAVLGGLILRFGKYETFRAESFPIIVEFPNAYGIVRDAAVLYAGIPVGKVSGIQLEPSGRQQVNLTLSIHNDYRGMLRRNAEFIINQAGLLGDRYVDVIPHGSDAPPLEPGDRLKGTASIDLTEAVRSVVETLRKTAGTIERVDKALQRIDDTVLSRQTLDHLSSSMTHLDAASSNAVELIVSSKNVLTDNREELAKTVAEFHQAAATLHATAQRADNLIAGNADEVTATLKRLGDAAARLDSILVNAQQGTGTVGRLLVDPALHDELLQLIQNLRQHGLFYRDRTPSPKRGMTPVPARPAKP